MHLARPSQRKQGLPINWAIRIIACNAIDILTYNQKIYSKGLGGSKGLVTSEQTSLILNSCIFDSMHFLLSCETILLLPSIRLMHQSWADSGVSKGFQNLKNVHLILYIFFILPSKIFKITFTFLNLNAFFTYRLSRNFF